MNAQLAEKIDSALFEKISWKINFGFECYGVRIGIRSDTSCFSILKEMLPTTGRITDFEGSKEIVSVVADEDKTINGLYYNNELAYKFEENQKFLAEILRDKFLIILSLASLPKRFYLHAGAFVWNNRGIIVPGESFSGKTTLVKEFVKAGAVYITDDLTILAETGEILPFPRTLEVRTETGRELQTAESLGGRTLTEKVKLEIILFTEFEEKAEWKPQILPPGQAVLKLMDNFYYRSSIIEAPSRIVKTLAGLTGGIKIYTSKRGNAKSVIDWMAGNF